MADSFTYQAFRVQNDRRTVLFDYKIARGEATYELTEILKFPVKLSDSGSQQACLKALHLALGISYYKIFLSSETLHPYQMNEAEAAFWNDVWRNGLGEFLYVNKLSPDVLAKFAPQAGIAFEPGSDKLKPTVLLGLGGGKDSAVAGELLKSLGNETQGFVMATGEQLGQTQAVADAMNIPLNVVTRVLDKRLLDLQELPDAYKGHIPISLIFGLVGTALAAAKNSSYVVVANEASASIPRIVGEHGAVNHQWSKSFYFEQLLQNYIHSNISSEITYFSAIRQLTSVAVAKLFVRLPQYFEVFTSDNYVFRIDPKSRPNARWSLGSPKSLSSFMLLAPWLSEPEMLRIFEQNFLDEPSLETLFLELVGVKGEPPLDCVGTTDELVLSLNLAAEQGKFSNSYLMKLAKDSDIITKKDWQTELKSMLRLHSEQAMPPALIEAITKKLQAEVAE